MSRCVEWVVMLCRMVSNCVEPCCNVSNGVELCRKVSNDVEWCQMVSNCVECCQTVSNRVESCRIVFCCIIPCHAVSWLALCIIYHIAVALLSTSCLRSRLSSIINRLLRQSQAAGIWRRRRHSVCLGYNHRQTKWHLPRSHCQHNEHVLCRQRR